jgi:hypothetical protein
MDTRLSGERSDFFESETCREDGSATGNRSCDPLNFAPKNNEDFLVLLHLEFAERREFPNSWSHPFLHKNW